MIPGKLQTVEVWYADCFAVRRFGQTLAMFFAETQTAELESEL
jgi:hypothetical protein